MAVPTTHTSSTNLPADLTSFIGRRKEMADVRRQLSAARLVTLTGPGGVGKTRLALRVAGGVANSYPDGAWLVELAAVRSGEDVAHALADVMGLRSAPGMPLREALAGHLAERKLLIVLDNCEHVVGEASTLVHDLLRRCPAVRVLATSRESFGLTGEHVVPVHALSFPERGPRTGEPDGLSQWDAVTLFVERAAAGCPGFTLNAQNSESITSICSALEGMPLAIELAAVRVRTLPLDAIVESLKSHSPTRRRVHTYPEHHRSLRASVEWSYELCTAEERSLWDRLSVFSGGFVLEAAHAVCGPDESLGEVTDAVASLVEKSILSWEPSPSEGRYRMLESLREFGEERLAEARNESAETCGRHRDFFVALAERSADGWLSAEQPAVLAQMRDEYGNLRVAYSRSLADQEEVSYALVIASALEHYWLVRGWQSEGRQWLDNALSVAKEPTPERARALRVNVYLTALQGELAAAGEMAAEARSIASRAGDDLELSYITMHEGLIELCAGRLEAARGLLDVALARFEEQRNPLGEARTLVVLTAVAAAMEDLPLAESCHRRCMALTEPGQEVYLRGFSLWGCGLASLRDGDHDRARELERASLLLKRSIADQLGMVLCIEALAWIDAAGGRYEQAGVLLGASERLWSPMRMTMATILDFGRFRAEYESALLRGLGRRRLDSARRRGAQMPVEQVLRLALGESEKPTGSASPLTPREAQIAEMVARGLTNKRIAQELTLSQRTVEGHVEQILNKLGFTGRTQIAAWVADQRNDQRNDH